MQAANRRLSGDLVLKGIGDPSFGVEDLRRLLRRLREQGIQSIEGDVVLDRSAFDPGPHDPAAFDGEPYGAYNVGPDALLLAHKAVGVRLSPAGAEVRVALDPHPAGLDVLSRIAATDGPCADWRDTVRPDLFRHGLVTRLVLTGTFPRACGERTLEVGLLEHGEFVGGVVRQVWAELGGTLRGTVRDGVVPEGAHLLAEHTSPPLAEVVRTINKHSNNVMARQLLLTLGAARGARPARVADGVAAIREWLDATGIGSEGVVIENGSGLSRNERISAGQLGRLLEHAWHSPVMPEFMASLPIAGVDGTLTRRFADSPIAGRAHLKTGYLNGVRALAGYVLDRHDRRWVVVMLVNHPNALQAREAMDALVEWVWRGGEGP